MNDTDKAYWLADKIPAYGDYAKEAADLLKKQADELILLRGSYARIAERLDALILMVKEK